MKKKDKENKQEQERPDDWEPDWINPANDRKTPYTEDELKKICSRIHGQYERHQCS
jgi:hypothetical protein